MSDTMPAPDSARRPMYLCGDCAAKLRDRGAPMIDGAQISLGIACQGAHARYAPHATSAIEASEADRAVLVVEPPPAPEAEPQAHATSGFALPAPSLTEIATRIVAGALVKDGAGALDEILIEHAVLMARHLRRLTNGE